jgi:ATP-dependent DNA helicase RecG
MLENALGRLERMRFKEGETVELKRSVVDEIKKEVIAFANSSGGTLYIGVADDGEVVGLDDPENALLSVNNMLRDAINPDITLFAQSGIERIDDKKIISIAVQRGTKRPYYLAGKGIRPEGVYVRHGAASVHATDAAIRSMIRETDGDSYERIRSVSQELIFTSAEAEFSQREIEFGLSQMTTLGLVNADKIYTNLGLLLSDNCVHTIKAAVFQDASQQMFKDRREFGGSLFKQLNDVYDFLDLRNQVRATFDKLLRVDTRDYPETALREALLNAVVHREYAVSGAILIKMFSDRVEFISPGGLFGGVELDDIMSGYSVCRNPALAAVFYRLRLIEAYGTGILKIFEAYDNSTSKPKIEATPNVFKIILPNINEALKTAPLPVLGETPEDRVLRFARDNGAITREETEHLLGIAQTTAGQILRRLVDAGTLIKKGGSRSTIYLPPRA